MVPGDREALPSLQRAVTRAVIPEGSPSTLLQRSCDAFVASELYATAWIGLVDSTANSLVPAAAAGVDLEGLDDVPLDDPPARRCSIADAAESRALRVESERDDRAIAAVPLCSDGTLHGVVHLETDRSNAFEDEEREVLGRVADVVAYAYEDAEPAASSDDSVSDRSGEGAATAGTTPQRDERALHAAERRLDVAAAAGSVGLWTWDVQADVVTADEYLAATYGIDPAEAAAGAPMEAFYEPIHEDDEARTREQLERALEETGELEAEYRVRNAEGELVWVQARGEVEYDEDGTPVRLYGAVSDVTERKRRERRTAFLDELNQSLHSLTDPDEIVAATVRQLAERLDADRCTYAEFEGDGDEVRVVGAYADPSAEDVAGAEPTNVERERDAGPFVEDALASLRANESRAVADVGVDECLSDADRDAYDEIGVRSVVHVPLHEDGELVAGMALSQRTPREWYSHEVDLVATALRRCWESLERARTRRELQENEQHLRALVETTPECIKVVGEEGTLLDMNPAGLELVQAESGSMVIGESVYDLIAPEDRETFREFNERVCQGESGTLEFDIVGLNGDRRRMETHAAPLQKPDGTTAHVALTRDITERKERERELEQYRTITQTASDAIVVIDESSVVHSANPAVEDVFGYEPNELLGESLTKLMSAELSAEHREGFQRYLETGDRSLDWNRVELPGRHRDGHEVPLAISFSEYEYDGERYFAGIIRDVTERTQYERALDGLHAATRDLIGAETAADVAARTLDTATSVLDLDGVGVYLFDEADNELQPAAVTEYVEELFGDVPSFGPGDTSITWETFLAGETVTYDDVLESDDVHTSETPLRSGIWIPLGDHGVLAIVSESVDGIDQHVQQLADHLAATAEAALDRVAREERLREHERNLAAQNRRLQALDRMNSVIREIDQRLVAATTTDEVEQSVCELLTGNERFAFAWIGGVEGGSVVPRTVAGDGRGYLDETSLAIDADGADTAAANGGSEVTTADSGDDAAISRGGDDAAEADRNGDATAAGDQSSASGGSSAGSADSAASLADPAVATAASGEVTVVANTASELGTAPWRRAALSRDLQSAIAVPIRYGETRYGVLAVYAAETNAFDDLAQSVFAELGETIGNAIHAVETERALLTDTVVELDFAIRDADDPLVALVEETGCTLSFEGIVPQSAGTARVFVTATGVDSDDVLAAAERSSRIERVTLLDSPGDEHRFEVTVGERTVPSTLVECGAAVESVTITPEETRTVVELPHSIDVRTFVDRLEATYPGAQLVARRDKERSDPSSRGFESELESELTARQLEVLRTAYLSGYFEWPRERTGEEVAATLDITQSTFNGHLRTAERKLCGLLFEHVQNPN